MWSEGANQYQIYQILLVLWDCLEILFEEEQSDKLKPNYLVFYLFN